MKAPKQKQPSAIPLGVYASAITPRREGEVEVDLGSMLEVIDFVSSRGVDGIVLFGSVGEFVHYTAEERSRFVALATKRSRVPILANVSHSTLNGAIALAEEAAGAGVAGVLVMPPYYFRYDADSITAFYEEFANAVAKWTPIYIQNSPAFTNPIPIETAEALLRSGAFAGINEASGEVSYFERLLDLRSETPLVLLCGDDSLFSQTRRSGANGGVSAVASAIPELMAALNRAIADGDQMSAAHLETKLEEFLAWSRQFPVPVAVREAAILRKLKAGASAVPLSSAQKQRLDNFRDWFRDWIHVVENECKIK
jgi:dihydrodipicolinate synthase/N-acetylneuraminate lyase